MDGKIVDLLRLTRVLVATHADVALLKDKTHVVVSDKHPESDIKFAILNQQRLFYVLLNHKNIRFYYRKWFLHFWLFTIILLIFLKNCLCRFTWLNFNTLSIVVQQLLKLLKA
jgi:hypothetical protein